MAKPKTTNVDRQMLNGDIALALYKNNYLLKADVDLQRFTATSECLLDNVMELSKR